MTNEIAIILKFSINIKKMIYSFSEYFIWLETSLNPCMLFYFIYLLRFAKYTVYITLFNDNKK